MVIKYMSKCVLILGISWAIFIVKVVIEIVITLKPLEYLSSMNAI